MKYYCSLDVSLNSTATCIVNHDGTIIRESEVPSEPAAIDQWLKATGLPIERVGLEAGGLSSWLCQELLAGGWPVICIETRHAKAAMKAQQVKTDRNDARGLAQILRSGWYRTVHVKSLESHQVRALLASRKAILVKCVDLENELRGLLKIFGVRLASRVGHGSFDEAVRKAITAEPLLARALVPLLDARTVLYKTYLKLDNAVKAVVRTDPVCQRLMTVPGVGPVTSLTFKAGVDDVNRFRSSRTVAAHFGLTPRRYQSGETDNPGRISKAGDRDVRMALYTAAHALMTRSDAWSTLKAWGLRLAKIRGHRRAVVAVARKLAVILHRMWVDGTDFRAARLQGAA